jgi:CheY-like chemotaxis protein
MGEAAIAHLFEPFSDLAEAGIRPGLELAAVYSVLSQGGGGISVESGPGGTRFDLYFLSAPPVASAAPPAASLRRASQGARILLVEDQEQVRLFTSQVLKEAGFDVIAVEDGAAALSILDQCGDDKTLLLTDVVMPAISGREVAVQARQIRPGLPIVFMSGYAEAGPTAAELADMGAHYLQKPFTPDQLVSAVREALDRSEPVRIVIADDDPGVRALLCAVLEGAGYFVIEAAEGASAIQALQNHQADLLITDLVMPGQEGIETIRTAKQNWPDLKIVAISGAFYGQFLRTAEVLGAKAVLQKPIRPEDLLRTVRDVLQS